MPITQAGKTIIFEQFTDRNFDDGRIKERLDFMLSSDMSDGDIIEIEEALSVSSYEEFIQKFKPVIYKRELKNEATGEHIFEYSLEEPDSYNDIIDITQQDFYKVIMRIYEQKKSSGQDNFSFDYESAKKMLLPEKIVSGLKKNRKELEYNFMKSIELQEKSPARAKNHRIKTNKLLNNIGNIIYSKDQLQLLPILIDDAQTKIECYERAEKESERLGIETDEAPVLRLCTSSFDEEGNLVQTVVTSENQPQSDVKLLATEREQFLTLVDNHFTQNALVEVKENNYLKSAVMSVLCGVKDKNEITALPPKSELIQRRDAYTKAYKLMQESFAKQMVSIVEKLVNIRAFFDHAGENGVLRNNEKVIIANCTVADLMEGDKKPCFTRFMNFLGNQSNDQKIWYAIVPAVRDELFEDEDYNISFDLNDFGTGMSGDDEKNNGLNTITYSDLKEYCDAVKDSKIMTFFNFKANEATGFSKLTPDVVDTYKDLCNEISADYKKYSVLCYPNFTLLPKDKNRSEIGKVVCDVEEQGVIIQNGGEENVYLDMPSVYVDSSYIACGMMISAHNNRYIKSKVKDVEIEGDYPAVRFDYEGVIPVDESDVICNRVFTTRMNRELKFNTSKELKSALSDRFGFCFGSNDIITADKTVIDNAYVLSARTIAEEEVRNSNGTSSTQIQPVFKTVVGTFIEMLFASYGSDSNALEILNDETDHWSYEDHLKRVNNPLYRIRNTVNTEEAPEQERVVYKQTAPNRYKITVMYGSSPSEIEVET